MKKYETPYLDIYELNSQVGFCDLSGADAAEIEVPTDDDQVDKW